MRLNDLKRHTDSLLSEIQKAARDVIASGTFILGPQVEKFETAFAHYCGIAHAVAVANGTDALEIALRASGCGAGDEVVTVANAGGYATVAIINAGAKPVYTDIDPDNFLLTPASFLQAITPATKAVIVTHLYGLMVDMPALCEIAAQRHIIIIEDCAHAHGAAIQGKKAGTWGMFGCFSFYPTKNLGALGDAGCVVTNNDDFSKRLKSLRQYGWQEEKYHLAHIGRNSRMDELQAAILLCKLAYLDDWNDKRRQIIRRYREELQGYELFFQPIKDEKNFVAHLAVARTKKRDALMRFLNQENIATAIHYPIPDYQQPAVMRHTPGVKLPVTERITEEILTLPCFPEMIWEEVDAVVAAIKKYFINST